MVRIVVVGAGVVGLATAVNVQEALPGAKVTIMADKFDLDTTSSGAGGFFEHATHGGSGIPVETLKEWTRLSWDYYSGLAMSPLAEETGQTLVSGFILSNDPKHIQDPLYADIVFNYRELRPDELQRMKLPCSYGNTFTTVITRTKKFMPWLMRKFKQGGGTVEFRTIQKLEELAGSCDIVMNCSGLRARFLVNDPDVYPIKGQLVKVQAPWIKHFYYFINSDKTKPTYFFPHDDGIWVGGTKNDGDFSSDLSPEVEQGILSRAGKLLPQIKTGMVIGRWTGLRPQRDTIRLEKQLLHVNGKQLRVVHNYGHGANGVTLSWGTSLHAARLAKEWANEIPPSAKV